jgi:hypothetical protein
VPACFAKAPKVQHGARSEVSRQFRILRLPAVAGFRVKRLALLVNFYYFSARDVIVLQWLRLVLVRNFAQNGNKNNSSITNII